MKRIKCPACGREFQAGHPFASHMRAHSQRGEAVKMFGKDGNGAWIKTGFKTGIIRCRQSEIQEQRGLAWGMK